MATETRLKALDGLRAIAVLEVVGYHYYFMPPRPGKWFEYLERIMSLVDGVTLFFALSGFLIGGILLSTRDRAGTIEVFYVRRFFRIVPLYALLLASYAAVRLLDNHFRFGLIYAWYSDIPWWSYLTVSQNMWIGQDQATGAIWLLVTWSLAVEQQFYLLVPWLVRWLKAGPLLVVAAAAWVAAALGSTPSGYRLTDRMDALAAGLILAILVHMPRARTWLQRYRPRLRLLVVLFFVFVAVEHVAGSWIDLLALRPVTSVVYALLIHLLAEDVPWPVVKPVIAWFAPLGLLSYCIYLFHFPILFLTQAFLSPSQLVAFLLTVGFAAISYRYFERPLIEYGRRFRAGAPARTA